MKEESRPYHIEVLALHKQNLFKDLIYEHNLTTNTLKEIEFVDVEGSPCSPIRGFFAVKDKRKYWISETIVEDLPIRVGNEVEELKHGEDIVIRPINPSKFKIVAEHTIETRKLIEDIAPFNHSNLVHWNLLKMIAVASFIGRTYVCIASESNFGKSSIFDIIHSLTDKSPVFKPRSVPGVLHQINGVGNMVFDEVHDCKREIKDIMEEFSLQIGGGKSVYINGAMKSKGTKSDYNCTLQSITFLFNDWDHYKSPEKEYFEYIFSNNKAVDNRFLKVRLKGVLTERFDRDFSLVKVAEENKTGYVGVAKELAFLQELKHSNTYARRYVPSNSLLNLKGRRKVIFDEITFIIDKYSKNQEEYDLYYTALEQSVLDYKSMLGEQTLVVEEEGV